MLEFEGLHLRLEVAGFSLEVVSSWD